jgi:hypothetical protein
VEKNLKKNQISHSILISPGDFNKSLLGDFDKNGASFIVLPNNHF